MAENNNVDEYIAEEDEHNNTAEDPHDELPLQELRDPRNAHMPHWVQGVDLRIFPYRRFRLILREECQGKLNGLFRSENSNGFRFLDPFISRTLVLVELAKALHFIHKQGLVAPNIQPSSVQMAFVYNSDRPKLIFKWGSLTRGTSAIWMPPEHLSDSSRRWTQKSDVFVAGLIFFYILACGLHPFGRHEETIISNLKYSLPINFYALWEWNIFNNVLRKMLNRDVNARINSGNVVQLLFEILHNKLIELCSTPDLTADDLHPMKEVSDIIDINCCDSGGMTPFLLLCRHNKSPDLYSFLQKLMSKHNRLKTPVDVNRKDEKGYNALMHLILYNFEHSDFLQLLRYLVSDCRVRLEERELRNGWTILHILTDGYFGCDNFLPAVEFLVAEAGMDVSIESNDGRTALDFFLWIFPDGPDDDWSRRLFQLLTPRDT